MENVLVSLHSLKTMVLGPFGASAPLFLRNGELLGHSPILIDPMDCKLFISMIDMQLTRTLMFDLFKVFKGSLLSSQYLPH